MLVASFVTTAGLIPVIVGNETLSAKLNVPDPLVEITCPLVPSVIGNFKNTPVFIVGELCIV